MTRVRAPFEPCRYCGSNGVTAQVRPVADGHPKEVFSCPSCGREWVNACFGLPPRGFTEQGTRT